MIDKEMIWALQDLVNVTMRELLWILVDAPKENIIVHLGQIEIKYPIAELQKRSKSTKEFLQYIRSKLNFQSEEKHD